jgi:zinc/manganese transport system permease protein
MEHLLDPYSLLVEPLTSYAFMRRALVACLALALSSGPIGVFLVLRRMSLMGDAMSHAVLPGAAIGFIFAGLSLGAMSIGGLIAGLTVALLAGVTARTTVLREDASLAGFYLASLALGVLLVSIYGSAVDLLHVLFGSILAVDDEGLLFVASVASVTLITLAVIYRPLVAECFDPNFLRSVGARGSVIHLLFLVLVVLNLVAGFQALGTLMAVGLMMLPAAAARFWSDTVGGAIAFATGTAMASGVVGLLLSYHFELPSGPAIVLTAAVVYLASIVFGSRAGLLVRYRRRPHFHEPEEIKS